MRGESWVPLGTHDFLFNGVNLSRYGKVETIERTLLPPRSYSRESGKGTLEQDIRSVSVTFRVIAGSRQQLTEYLSDLAAILYQDRPCPMQLRDLPRRYEDVILTRCTYDKDKSQISALVSMDFVNPSGVYYGEERSALVGQDGRLVIDSLGNTDSYPVITGVLKGQAPLTIQYGKGKIFRLTRAISGALTLDSRDETCLIGVKNQLNLVPLTDDFVSLHSGRNELSFSADLDAIEVRWRDRWI